MFERTLSVNYGDNGCAGRRVSVARERMRIRVCEHTSTRVCTHTTPRARGTWKQMCGTVQSLNIASHPVATRRFRTRTRTRTRTPATGNQQPAPAPARHSTEWLGKYMADLLKGGMKQRIQHAGFTLRLSTRTGQGSSATRHPHPAPGSRHRAPDTCYPAPDTRHPAPGTPATRPPGHPATRHTRLPAHAAPAEVCSLPLLRGLAVGSRNLASLTTPECPLPNSDSDMTKRDE